MKITCPKCQTPVPAAQLNVATDVGVCPHCNEAFSISDLVCAGQDDSEGFDINQPPRGAWFFDNGNEWQIGATTRSALAFFMVPFMCVWSGGSLGGIYGSQIAKGEFNLMLSLFGIPFVLGTLVFGSLAIMSICGKVLLSVEHDQARLFTGVGSLGWTRRFEWSSIHGAEEEYSNFRNGNDNQIIALLGQKRIKFGSMLSQERRYYFVRSLRTLLARQP